jgi:hypothetical protein
MKKKRKFIAPLTAGIAFFLIGTTLYFYPKQEVKATKKPDPRMSFFITSSNPGQGGNLGGLIGADAYCQKLADQAKNPKREWSAYLSTSKNGPVSEVNAKDRIGSGPWYNYNGDLIANNVEELHLFSMINKSTALTETGEFVSGRGDEVNTHDILTGSNMEGMSVATSTDTTCSSWTSSASGSAYVGHHDRIGINESAPMKSWNSSHLTKGCSQEAFKSTGGSGLFYCFAK